MKKQSIPGLGQRGPKPSRKHLRPEIRKWPGNDRDESERHRNWLEGTPAGHVGDNLKSRDINNSSK